MQIESLSEWLSMKQVTTKTNLRATTISRYKDEFPEYIIYRMNGQLLEFSASAVPLLIYIYDLFRDRSEGRRTIEKVREHLFKKYGAGEPTVIDVIVPTTTPQNEDSSIKQFLAFMQEQNNRLGNIEEEQIEARRRDDILFEQNAEILGNQLEIKKAVNERLAMISEVAATRRGQKGLWSKIISFLS